MPKITVDRAFLLKVAKNCRLELAEKEIELFLPQFKDMLGAFEKIDRADVKNTEPAFHPVPLQNRYREDKIIPGLTNEEALSNAVHQKPPYFKGPKAIEQA